jgi:heme-degrading monooxygenase HmoA
MELLTLPPTAEAIASMSVLPRSHISPVMLGTVQGPCGDLGPEAAGAILMLQATFTTQDGHEAFWRAQAPLMELLSTAAGFMRSYGFGDGPSSTLLVFWRTVDDAKAFAASHEHRQAMRDLYTHRWQYSHFAAIWEMASNHDRIIFCPDCAGVTSASAQHCAGCGAELFDVYRAS